MFSVTLVSVNTGPQAKFSAIGTLVSLGGGAPPAEPSELVIPWRDLHDDPEEISLLSWHTRQSAFLGRDKEMEDLVDWARTGPMVSARFVMGEGGAGKSRLGAEFAQVLQQKKWAAGFVDLRKSAKFGMGKTGTLLVVDYPEEHRQAVAELFKDLAALGNGHRVRVLFLTRQPPDQWDAAIAEGNARDVVVSRPVEVGRLVIEDAHEVYHSALKNLSEKLGTTPFPLPLEALKAWIGQSPEENERGLFLMALALYSALHPKDVAVHYTAREVMEALAVREEDRLFRLGKAHGLADENGFARVLALAAIAGELSKETVCEWCKDPSLNPGFAAGQNAGKTLESAGLVRGGKVPAPKPDILASLLCHRALSQIPKQAPELVWAALEPDVPGGMSRLGRQAHDAEYTLSLPGDGLPQWLETAVGGQPSRCSALQSIFKEANPILILVNTGVQVWKTLLETADREENKVSFLHNLSGYLSYTGDREGSLAAGREAAEIYRRLAEKAPTAFLPGLAMSLNNLSLWLSEAGDRDGSLVTIHEAVEIRQKLAEKAPAAFLPDLATSLHNLSKCLSESGDRDGALEAIRKAVEIRQKLAETAPATFLPDLASSLNNLAIFLSVSGDLESALTASRKAMEVYRNLAERTPAAFLPYLALSLSNLSNRLSQTGDRESALAASREAVEIHQKLAEKAPAVFLPNLASSINNLTNHLSLTGDREGALAAIREAVEIRRKLAEKAPAAFLSDLASILNNFSVRLSESGDREGAFAASCEAVEICRKLAEKAPAAFLPDLAMSLNNLSNRVSEAGDREGALAAIREAVEIRRKLAEKAPAAFLPYLAMSLNNLSVCLSSANDRDGAREAIHETVDIYRKLVEKTPAAFLPYLAGSLNNFSGELSHAGDRDGALAAIREAVDIQRKLAEKVPAAFLPELARSLGNQARIFWKIGNKKETRTALGEALGHVRPFAEKWPGSPHGGLYRWLLALREDYSRGDDEG